MTASSMATVRLGQHFQLGRMRLPAQARSGPARFAAEEPDGSRNIIRRDAPEQAGKKPHLVRAACRAAYLTGDPDGVAEQHTKVASRTVAERGAKQ